MSDRDIVIGRTHDGRKTGEVYVTLASVQVAEVCLEERQKKEIHGRYIELFRSSEEDREVARASRRTGRL